MHKQSDIHFDYRSMRSREYMSDNSDITKSGSKEELHPGQKPVYNTVSMEMDTSIMASNNGGDGVWKDALHAGHKHHEIAQDDGDDLHLNMVPAVTTATYIYALCAAINSCNLGYDVGVNTQAGPRLQDDMELTDRQLEYFLGSLNLYAMVGALSAHIISDRYGRRASFILAAILFIVGVGVVAMGQTFEVLMLGRVAVGLGVGFGLAIDSLYIAEIAPAAHRGRLVTWCEIGTNVGVLSGFASGYIFAGMETGLQWRAMIGMGAFLPFLMILLATFVMPESPRWLISKGRVEEARHVLHKTHPPDYDINPIVADIQESFRHEREGSTSASWSLIFFPTPAIRRMLIIGLGTAIAQQAVGIDGIQYFMLFIIKASGVESETNQTSLLVILGLVKLVFAWLGGRLFDNQGRRKLFFVSLGGMVISLIMLAINFTGDNRSPALAVSGLALYLATFSVGMGPGAWLVPSEVLATVIRAKAMSVATFLNRLFATFMASSVLSVADALTWSGFFIMLITMCVISAGFLYIYLPETKGKTLEEMTLYFANITGDRSILDMEKRVDPQDANIPVGGRSEDEHHSNTAGIHA